MLRQSRRRLSSCAYSLATDRWIDEAIIGLNLCPYTKAVRKRAAVRTRICNSAIDEATLLKEIDAEATLLAAGETETSLLVVPPSTPWGIALHDDFAKFLSLGWVVEDRLAELAPSTLQLQLALFHPLAVRNIYTAAEEEAVDYAMRAPHPTIHLLRTSDVAAVPPASAAAVPERNRAKLAEVGLEKLRDLYSGMIVS